MLLAAAAVSAGPALRGMGAARAQTGAPQTRSRLVEVVAGGKGAVDWPQGVVRASGYAPPQRGASSPSESAVLAAIAAKAVAQRNLAEAVGAVRVEGRTTVRNLQLEDDAVASEVSALLRNVRVVREELNRDGSARVTVEMPLFGAGRGLVEAFEEKVFTATALPEPPRAPADRGPQPEAAAPATPAAPEHKEPSAVVAPAPAPEPAGGGGGKPVSVRPLRPGEMRVARVSGFPKPAEGECTSLLVDARGIEMYPCMAPKLYSESGREVFGTIKVSSDWAIEHGVVSFPRSMEHALTVPRCGARPFVVKALRSAGPGKTNLVISDEDAARVEAANERSGFFEACAVIFLSEGR